MSEKKHYWQEIHALAVKHHSRAFEAEAKRKEDAPVEWQKALDYWGQLFRMNEFWQSLKEKGRKLEPSLFEDDQGINELREALPKFLLEIHTTFILDIIDWDISRASYHFNLIRNSHLGQSKEDSKRFQEEARYQIYKQRFREDLLEQKEEEKFETAIYLAEPIHLLDPTEDTAKFLLNIHLTWIRKYETEQLAIVQENYQEYSEIISKIETEDDEFEYMEYAEDIYAEIREDEEIQALQEEQTMLIDNLEPIVLDALEYCDYRNKPSIRRMISQALYFVGRHYCTTDEERDIDAASEYLEEAVEIEPGNEAARKLLEQLYELEDWE